MKNIYFDITLALDRGTKAIPSNTEPKYQICGDCVYRRLNFMHTLCWNVRDVHRRMDITPEMFYK